MPFHDHVAFIHDFKLAERKNARWIILLEVVQNKLLASLKGLIPSEARSTGVSRLSCSKQCHKPNNTFGDNLCRVHACTWAQGKISGSLNALQHIWSHLFRRHEVESVGDGNLAIKIYLSLSSAPFLILGDPQHNFGFYLLLHRENWKTTVFCGVVLDVSALTKV